MRLTTAIVLLAPVLFGCTALPSHPRTLLGQGIDFLDQEEFGMADLLFAAALRVDSTLDDAWYYRGLPLADQDEPEPADSRLTRGRSADNSGQFEAASISYKKFLQLVPESDPDIPAVRLRLKRLAR